MALILSVETSTSVCSAALHVSGKLVLDKQNNVPQTTASTLAVMIDSLFHESKYSPRDLAAVTVSAGPGSYTGLRIGVATAKGLCYGLSIPLVAINTLQLLTYQVVKQQGVADEATLYCPMLDARRMEVYTLLAKSHKDVIESTDARVIDEHSYSQWLQTHRIIFFGDGAAKCEPVITSPRAFFLNDIYPQAAALGEIGFEKFEKQQFEDLERYEPFYLKDFIIKKPKTLV
jgi:tRNA threonylcarbamoyladenosine biosynthesis protein TsaB